jgi:hypothetical protein
MIFFQEARWSRLSRVLPGLFSAILLVSSAGGEVVERIAAVVNGEIVFLTDVERQLAFFHSPDASRFSAPSPPRSESSPSSQDPRLKEGLQELIDFRLLLAEARRFGAESPPESEVDKVYQTIQGSFSGKETFGETLQNFATTPEEFKEEIRNRLLVDRFIDQRIRFFIFITPEDIQRYYEENKEKFTGKSLESVRESIQKEILDERARIRLKDYVNRLRSRAEIRINL